VSRLNAINSLDPEHKKGGQGCGVGDKVAGGLWMSHFLI